MTSTFKIGCNGRGARLSSLQKPVALEEVSIDEQFRLVKEAGVFDYFDRLPSAENLGEYRKAMDKYDLPVLTASWFYRLGENDGSISDNLRISKEIGASLHNIMIYTRHADGHVLRNEEIVDCYLRTTTKD